MPNTPTETRTLDLSKARIKSVQHIIIPFKDFGLNVTNVTEFSKDLIKVLDYDDKLIGYGVLEYNQEGSLDRHLCLNLNIDYGTPERLNMDLEEFFLDFQPDIKLRMEMNCNANKTTLDALTIEKLSIPCIRVLTSHQVTNHNLGWGFEQDRG